MNSIKEFPKISLAFKRIAPQLIQEEVKSVPKVELIKLIPDKITKQVLRLKRSEKLADSPFVGLKDGSMVKVTSLTASIAAKDAKAKAQEASGSKKDFIFRKLRISSAINGEIVQFFSSSQVPKILRLDQGHWFISQINLTDSMERADIEWSLADGGSHSIHFENISSNLKRFEGPLRHVIASKLNTKTVPLINFVYLES